MREMINNSEGEMQKRINEAEGVAAEILSIGEATAVSISKVASAIKGQGGTEAMKLELGQKYIQSLKQLENGKRVILSGNLSNMNEMLKEMGLDI